MFVLGDPGMAIYSLMLYGYLRFPVEDVDHPVLETNEPRGLRLGGKRHYEVPA